MEITEKQLMNLKELCQYLGKSETAVKRIIYNDGHKFTKDRFFSRVLVDRWLAEPDPKKDEAEAEVDKIVDGMLGRVFNGV